ncbi:hypothetical protein CDCA_CDCA13G3659 [Cyanidium caldarium]|uniref:Uncharacterized protein n=1 Tax=Cyanidium caldarium TaxID=2771 RepID=A0AAV9IZX9_CYACA|nr:hypothetical protein CDCA_CDCA13G3659 [Cyanidium caldarium]
MDALAVATLPLVQFLERSLRLWRRCTKPDRREYLRILQAVAMGILVMGAIGYVVRLVHIPINNILLG